MYWMAMGIYGLRKNEMIAPSGRPSPDYFEIKDEALKVEWAGKKIPMQVFHDAYFGGKTNVKYQSDRMALTMTFELVKRVLTPPLTSYHAHRYRDYSFEK
ncbi:hypothetical protein FRC07_000128 [Ceratobasidium sp. 392]|nr:hypothetical protein FRC07_000128 [Ceratobasidium sp. 392]